MSPKACPSIYYAKNAIDPGDILAQFGDSCGGANKVICPLRMGKCLKRTSNVNRQIKMARDTRNTSRL